MSKFAIKLNACDQLVESGGQILILIVSFSDGFAEFLDFFQFLMESGFAALSALAIQPVINGLHQSENFFGLNRFHAVLHGAV